MMGRTCAIPRCSKLAVDNRHCDHHKRERFKLKAEQRSQAGKWAQIQYRTKRWAARRKAQLTLHPYCQCPQHDGKRVPATIADHVEPHRGDPHKFWYGELMSLTKRCHDGWAQKKDRRHDDAEH
jgi:5-methylcytosine-specific restriction protein A